MLVVANAVLAETAEASVLTTCNRPPDNVLAQRTYVSLNVHIR